MELYQHIASAPTRNIKVLRRALRPSAGVVFSIVWQGGTCHGRPGR
jgi:hypothetical protein